MTRRSGFIHLRQKDDNSAVTVAWDWGDAVLRWGLSMCSPDEPNWSKAKGRLIASGRMRSKRVGLIHCPEQPTVARAEALILSEVYNTPLKSMPRWWSKFLQTVNLKFRIALAILEDIVIQEGIELKKPVRDPDATKKRKLSRSDLRIILSGEEYRVAPVVRFGMGPLANDFLLLVERISSDLVIIDDKARDVEQMLLSLREKHWS